MLPKRNRLAKRKEIKKAFSTRFRTRTKFTNMSLSKISEGGFKLLIVVPKKVFKKMHDRTRVRRRVSSVFEVWKKDNILPDRTVLIIYIKEQDILKASLDTITKDISIGYNELLEMPTKRYKEREKKQENQSVDKN